jgi:hypothetical protein
MSEISKQALKVDNSTSFPNNTTGYISPTILRAFNVNMIDSLVEQAGYTANSASWNVSIGQLNTYTASFAPSLTQLNAFTASQLTINTGVNSFTQSATGRLNNLESTTSSLNAFSSSINQILVNGVSIGTSTRFFFNGFVSASIVPNVDGAIADITVLSDPSLTPTASFNQYTASTAATQSVFSASVATSISSSNATFNAFSQSQNSFNLSATASIVELLNLSSSLSGGYATQGELDQSASVLQANINQKLFTSSFNDYTQSFSQSVATSFSQSYAFINDYSQSTNVFVSTSIANVSASIAITDNAQTVRINSLSSFTGSYATTGSNTFIGNQTINGTTRLVGNLTITGSVFGNVSASSITSQTASIDLSVANYFTLTLSGSTRLNITNPQPGVTATLVINTSTGASASFSSNVKQPSGSFYAASPSGNIDIISFTAVDSTTVYAFPAQSFV